MLEELRVMAEEGFPKAKEEWEKSVVAWGKFIFCFSIRNVLIVPCRETSGES